MNMLLKILPPCLFHRLFGLYCPGCGGTRAIYALLTGHILKSLYYHPLILYTVVCFLWYFLKKTLHIWMPSYNRLLYIAAGLVIVNCITRNVLYLGFGIAL